MSYFIALLGYFEGKVINVKVINFVLLTDCYLHLFIWYGKYVIYLLSGFFYAILLPSLMMDYSVSSLD